MKYAVINQYGITLSAGRKNGKYLYIPKSNGEQSNHDCSAWIKRNDPANTCAIVEMDEVSQAAAVLGSSKSDRKTATSRENGKKGGRPKLVPFSKEWKLKRKVWIQDHVNYSGETVFKLHYIENDTEYTTGEYFTRKDANEALKLINKK